MTRLAWLWGILTLATFATATAADAFDLKKMAITDLHQVDGDFAYQGEYTGAVWEPCVGCVCVGLQVVSSGGGKFEALEYRGGLPGAGWDRRTRRSLSGKLAGTTLTLRGENREVYTNGVLATVYDPAGTALGQLCKVQRTSPTMHATPAAGAVVLFEGSPTTEFKDVRVTADGLLEVGGLTKMPVGDLRLHLEFRIPYMPYATGQGRGNSGVYIQQRYEVQVLDSFGLEPAFNDCGALYRQQAPDLNMSLPPLTWQTYDIWFTAARWDGQGQKLANARITVLHNGVAIHSDREISGKTGAGKPEGPEKLPILLQNHGNPVHFRNVWIVPEPPPELGCQPAPRFGRVLARLPRLRRCR
jgi:hypothetical protein